VRGGGGGGGGGGGYQSTTKMQEINVFAANFKTYSLVYLGCQLLVFLLVRFR
jgi:hypothetical protein